MRALAVILLAALAGCGGGEPGPDVEVAADRSALAIDGNLRAAHSMGAFQPAGVLGDLAPAEAQTRALTDVIDAYRAAVRNVACLEVDTDETSYVDLEFRDCRLGLFGVFRVDGAIAAELSLETEPCADGECVTAVTYDLALEDVAIRVGRQEEGLAMQAQWQFHASLDSAAEMSLIGEASYTGPGGRSLATASETAWTRDGPCVELSSDGHIDALDDEGELLGGLSTSATDISACSGECPSAGSVRLAFARGDVLEWEYTGDDVVAVRAPGGDTTDVQLECEP